MIDSVEEVEQVLYVFRVYLKVKTLKYYSTISLNGIRIYTGYDCEFKQEALNTAISFIKNAKN